MATQSHLLSILSLDSTLSMLTGNDLPSPDFPTLITPSDRSVNVSEVYKYAYFTKHSLALNPDCLPSPAMKLGEVDILLILTKLFNLTLSQGVFPGYLNLAIIFAMRVTFFC